jgi:cysteine-rich repeat protein
MTLHGGLLATLLLTPVPALALQPLGHEFRPSAEQRSPVPPCTDAEGVRAVVDYLCPLGENEDGTCVGDPYGRKLMVAWLSSTGELVAGPYLISSGGGYPPYGCAVDGTVLVMWQSQALFFDRDGPRGGAVSVCQNEPCSVRQAAVAATADGFLVAWSRTGPELAGRFFSTSGSPTSDEWIINEPFPGSYVDAVAAMPGSDGDVVVAWVTNSWPSYGVSARATVVHADGTSEDDVVLNEFIHGPFQAIAVSREDPNRFVVAWENVESQAGWVARRIAVGDNLTTTTTTTSTTLDDLLPDFLPATTFVLTSATDVEKPLVPPALVADGAGHWIATWMDLFELAYPNRKTFGNFFASSGEDARRWSSVQPVSGDDSIATVPAAAAIDNGAVAVMTWTDLEGHDILYRRSTDGGQTWGESAPLHTIIVEQEDWEQRDRTAIGVGIAAGKNGRWVAAWMEYIWEEVLHEDYISLDVVRCAVRTSVSTDGALTWQEPQTLDELACDGWSDVNGDRGIDVATDGAGNWLVVWITGAFRASRSEDDASTWSLPITPFDVPDEQPRAIDIDASGDGHWLAALESSHAEAWPEQRSRVFVSSSADLAEGWSPVAGLEPWHDDDAGNDSAPSVATGENGQWGIAWESYEDVGGSGLDSDIVVTFSADDGASWSSPQVVDSAAVGDTRTDLTPQLAHSGETWGVLWRTIEQPEAYDTPWETSLRFARTAGACGNGQIDAGEECDDGNLESGDGCDVSCATTGCGSGVVSGEEQCDDGNDDDTDGCLSDCHLPVCGDGAAFQREEECDDGNSNDTDACLSDCTLAACGDSNVYVGVEECDNGPDRSDAGACLLNCNAARCGDGLLYKGVEECDDGNTEREDRCTELCRLNPVCGLGPRATTKDALTVLKKAVGVNVDCPMSRCDTNQDELITTSDALQTLRFAVGLDLVDPCGETRTLVIRLVSSEKVAALDFVMSYLDAPGDIAATGTKPSCTVVAGPGTLVARRLDPGRGLLIGAMINTSGVQGPFDLLHCQYRSVAEAVPGDFEFSGVFAWDRFGTEILPVPILAVTIE